MKKLINDPARVVDEMVEGLVAAHPGLVRLDSYTVLLREDFAAVREEQVALISGGGSGHEPAHAGYVGAGMLSAAVAGDVFTSPSSDSVLAAIRTVAGPRGVLLIVKNYTGDRLNFGLAAEMARAEGIEVESVIVADDVTLAETEDSAGRRGLAGTVFVHKIAGAAAAEGRSLSDVATIARTAAANVATMGVSLSAGIVPAVGKPSFLLRDDEMELGLGIHGEPGVERVRLEQVDAVVERMLDRIVSGRHRAALMINNLGATTNMELALVARKAVSSLRARGLDLERVYSGAFMTSLEMAGFSLSLLRVDEERLRWLDAVTSAPAWPNVGNHKPGPAARVPLLRTVGPRIQGGREPIAAIEVCCRALLDAQELLTELDRATGDGDLGVTMARGARALLDAEVAGSAADILAEIGRTLQRELGGSSGPLYGVFFLRAAQHVGEGDWAAAAEAGFIAISELGGAKEGDKTMLDALGPFARALRLSLNEGAGLGGALLKGAEAAEAGANRTAQMKAKRGRASYLGDRAMGHRDGGAVAAAIWLRALASSLVDI